MVSAHLDLVSSKPPSDTQLTVSILTSFQPFCSSGKINMLNKNLHYYESFFSTSLGVIHLLLFINVIDQITKLIILLVEKDEEFVTTVLKGSDCRVLEE